MSGIEDHHLTNQPAEGGVYVKGFHLEGAGWDGKNACLIEAAPMQLVCPMPTIHFRPAETKKRAGKGETGIDATNIPQTFGRHSTDSLWTFCRHSTDILQKFYRRSTDYLQCSKDILQTLPIYRPSMERRNSMHWFAAKQIHESLLQYRSIIFETTYDRYAAQKEEYPLDQESWRVCSAVKIRPLPAACWWITVYRAACWAPAERGRTTYGLVPFHLPSLSHTPPSSPPLSSNTRVPPLNFRSVQLPLLLLPRPRWTRGSAFLRHGSRS